MDGAGEIENMVSICHRLGDRFAYLGGLPTAEVYAQAYKAMGVDVYSSAVFNFIPRTALTFYKAVAENDRETTARLLSEFFLPYIAIQPRCRLCRKHRQGGCIDCWPVCRRCARATCGLHSPGPRGSGGTYRTTGPANLIGLQPAAQPKLDVFKNSASRSLFGLWNISRGLPSSPIRPSFMKMTRLETS